MRCGTIMAQTTEKDEKEISGLTCAYFDALNGSILSKIQTGSDFSSDFPVEKPLEVTFTKKKKKFSSAPQQGAAEGDEASLHVGLHWA